MAAKLTSPFTRRVLLTVAALSASIGTPATRAMSSAAFRRVSAFAD